MVLVVLLELVQEAVLVDGPADDQLLGGVLGLLGLVVADVDDFLLLRGGLLHDHVLGEGLEDWLACNVGHVVPQVAEYLGVPEEVADGGLRKLAVLRGALVYVLAPSYTLGRGHLDFGQYALVVSDLRVVFF